MFFVYCWKGDERQPAPDATPKVITPAKGVVILYDRTRSDTFLNPQRSVLSSFLYQHIFEGISVTGVQVTDNSQRQEPWFCPLLKADTLPLPSNFIKAGRQRKKNAAAIEQAKMRCALAADSIAGHLFLPQIYDRSDVAGALRLCVMAANSYAAKGLQPEVIMMCDLLQDLLADKSYEALEPVVFPAGTKIIVIGAHPGVDLSRLFGGAPVQELPSFQHLIL